MLYVCGMKIENVAVISLEDYAEYQELKAKQNKVNVSKLKTGSVVILRYNNQHCNSSVGICYDKPFDLVLISSEYYLIESNNKCILKRYNGGSYFTFHQNGKYIVYSCLENTDYITEVISY